MNSLKKHINVNGTGRLSKRRTALYPAYICRDDPPPEDYF